MSAPLNRTIMWLTWRQLFARRRLWLAAAFSLAPALFTVIFRVLVDDGPAAEASFFNTLIREIVIGTLLPLAALVFGTTAFGGEIDDGTLIYLLVKPIPRWHVLASKGVVTVLSTLAVVTPAIVLPWLLLGGPEVSPRAAASYLAGAAIGTLLYSAGFIALGLANRRALVIGLLYVVSFEGLLSRSLQGFKSLSVREFALSVAQASSRGAIVIDGAVSTSTVWVIGTIMLVVATWWTALHLVRYEVAERV
jgi:ABC-2 type transport system permease protein